MHLDQRVPEVPLPVRELIIVAFHFPPDNGSTGVLRTARFAQYLLNHGWRSHVVTAPPALYESIDEEAAKRVSPQIEIHRAWAQDVKELFGFGGVYPGWLAFPDRYWPWWFAGVRTGRQIIAANPVRAIYSTYPIATAHVIARSLKRRTGLPWIADFRDPWLDESVAPLRRRLEARLESSVLNEADRVICNTPAMRRDFLKRHPRISADKFVTITNGYDEADFSALIPEPTPEFQILYPGGLDAENRNPRGLFAGLRCALDRGLLQAADLKVTFLGCGPYGTSEQFKRDAEASRVTQFLDVRTERIPYRKALARMAGADVLVVLSENISGSAAVQAWTALQVPAKVYEYLRLQRPMLALVAEGAVKELLGKTAGNRTLGSGDTEAIAEALGEMYVHYRERRVLVANAPLDETRQYSRQDLSASLARELDALTAGQQELRR